MPAKIFVDTNVLVYVRDANEPEKQKQALEWMIHFWNSKTGRLSFQVLQEFYVTVTEKLKPGMKIRDARNDVSALLAWNPIPVEAPVVEGAWLIQDQYRLSWWDALIVSAAQIADCQYLLTENLQKGQKFDNLVVINPFLSSPESIKR
jgi:predicted nucleic acid-binding protein